MPNKIFKVELGRVNISLAEIQKLQKGSIIDLKAPAGEFAKMYINDQYFSECEIIVYNRNISFTVKLPKEYQENEIEENKIEKNIQTNNTLTSLPSEEGNEIINNFSYLNKIKPNILADFIINEHPQTIALILSHCKVSSVAKMLDLFPADLRSEVIIRISNMGDVSPTIINIVSEKLKEKLHTTLNNKIKNIGGVKFAAGILNNLEEDNKEATVNYIGQFDESLLNELIK